MFRIQLAETGYGDRLLLATTVGLVLFGSLMVLAKLPSVSKPFKNMEITNNYGTPEIQIDRVWAVLSMTLPWLLRKLDRWKYLSVIKQTPMVYK